MATIDDDDKARIGKDFREAVNMTPKELERWLATDESREVGWGRAGATP